MKPALLALGLVCVLATAPAACGRENEENEGAEMAEAAAKNGAAATSAEAREKAEEADEADEAGEAGESAEAHAALKARARVDSVTAMKTALERVKNGTVTQAELEEEDGMLIWSFDIKVPGQEGVEEVHVDAITGEVIKTEHESESGEASEKEGR